MGRILLNSTRAAQRAGLSATAFNQHLYKKNILNRRARPSKKDPTVMKPYCELLDLQYGQNFKNPHGGLTVFQIP